MTIKNMRRPEASLARRVDRYRRTTGGPRTRMAAAFDLYRGHAAGVGQDVEERFAAALAAFVEHQIHTLASEGSRA